MGMLIYMVHPNGARMPVYSTWVRDENLKNGWAIEPPRTNLSGPGDSAEPAQPRRGRPPKSNTHEAADD